MAAGVGENPMTMIEFVGSTNSGSSEAGMVKEEGDQQDWKRLENSTHLPEYKEGMENSLSFTSGVPDMTMSMEGTWTPESLRTSGGGHVHFGNVMGVGEEGFTNLLLNNSDDRRSLSDGGTDDSDNGGGSGSGSDYYEDNKNYWNSILNLVNSPPSDSPMF
jgi:myb proto-oncogene protein